MISSEFLDPTFLGFALDRINEAVVLIDEQSRVCYANQKANEIFNHSYEDSLPLYLSEIDLNFDLETWKAHWNQLRKSKYLSFEASILTKDKKPLPIEVSSSFYAYKDTEFELSIIRDISERKDALARLISANDYHRSLIETTLDPLAVSDPQGIITDVNKAMEVVTGLSRLELIGTDSTLYSDNREKAANEFATILSTGMLKFELINIRNKNGTLTPLLVNANTILNETGQIIGVFVACKDISERLKIEAELQQQNERYRNAQMIGHVGNWEYNIQTGEFWGSDEAKKIYGLDPTDLTFSTDQVEECIPERERVHQALIDLIEKEKPYALEFEIHPRDGSFPRIIASVAILHKDAQAQPVKVTGVIQDITERRNLQKHATELAEIVRTSDEAIIGETPDRIITSWNKGAEKIFGYTEAENWVNRSLSSSRIDTEMNPTRSISEFWLDKRSKMKRQNANERMDGRSLSHLPSHQSLISQES